MLFVEVDGCQNLWFPVSKIRSIAMALGTLFARKVITARPGESLAQVATVMEQHNVGAVVVVEQDRPVGIITDRDLALSTCIRGISPDEHVQNIMTCPVSTIRQDAGVFNATQQMMEHAVRRVPVVNDDGSLVGLVSLDDLLLLLSRELQKHG
jgi:CBS domain-containing protein